MAGSTKRRGQGEGSIYQRSSDGKWVGSATVGWVGGRRDRKVVYGRTQAEVIAKLKRLHSDIDQGLPIEDGNITVAQLLERWLVDVLPGRVSASTLDNYRTVVDQHIVPIIGRKRLAILSPADVQGLLTLKLRERLPRRIESKTGVKEVAVPGGYSPRTVKLIRGVLVQALGQAQRWGVVGRNVAALTEGPRQNRDEGRTLTREQARRLLAAAQGERLEAAFVLMLSLGLRRGEALGIRWRDVDFERHTLGVAQALKRVGSDVVLGDVKTPRSRRKINLPAEVIEILNTHRRAQEMEALAKSEYWKDSGLVFVNEVGRPIDPTGFRRTFDRVCGRAGLFGWHPHELRHSAASLMLAQGVPLEVVSRVLGHSSIRITADVYGHILEPQREQAAAAMGEVLWASAQSN